MIVKAILILSAVIAGLIFLQILVNHYLKKGDKVADPLHSLEKEAFDTVSSFLNTGEEFQKKSRYGQPNSFNEILKGAAWRAVNRAFSQFDPRLRIQRELTKLIQDALVALEEARQNAKSLNSPDALALVEDCVGELETISSSIDENCSPSKIRQRILDIKANAKKIAQAKAFNDSPNGKQKEQTHYDILGIAINATAEEIKKAFRELSMQYHPDRYQHLAADLRAQAEERFKSISEAYEFLSDQEKRKKYNEKITQGGG